MEAIFRLADDHGEWLYWFELSGTGGTGLTTERSIDRDHIAFAERAKAPGHTAAEPMLLLLPDPVEQVIRSWAAHGGDAGA